MAATPFKGTITIRYRSGRVQVENFTASDVANQFVTFVATNNNFVQCSNEIGAIHDISLSAAGADTTTLAVYANGADQNIRYLGAGLVATVNNRIPAPPSFRPGASIQLKQLA